VKDKELEEERTEEKNKGRGRNREILRQKEKNNFKQIKLEKVSTTWGGGSTAFSEML